MSRLKINLSAALASLVFASSLWAVTTYFEDEPFICSGIGTPASNCMNKLKKKKATGQFNFGMWVDDAYNIDNVWLRARKAGSSAWTKIGKHGGKIEGGLGNDGANGVMHTSL